MKTAAFITVATLILTVSATARATSVSTFNINQPNFSLTGFSWDDDGNSSTPNVPTLGPTTLKINEPPRSGIGDYNLNIPPAGGMYYVYASAWLGFDFDSNGTTDFGISLTNEYLGVYPSPGPGTSWGPGVIQNAQVSPDGINFFTLDVWFDVSLGSAATYPIGSFGFDAYADFTFSGQDIAVFNTYLTGMDNASGGGDGVIDGRLGAFITITAEPVPEPLTMLGVFMGIAGLARYVRRRNVPGGRRRA